jgi:hypothetical protein
LQVQFVLRSNLAPMPGDPAPVVRNTDAGRDRADLSHTLEMCFLSRCVR